MIAYSILSTLGEATSFAKRGVKIAECAVFNPLACSGFLVKLNLISNGPEAEKCADINFQTKIVTGFVNGVAKYDKI
jgi:N-acetylmuramoyl-L-alanine amidase